MILLDKFTQHVLEKDVASMPLMKRVFYRTAQIGYATIRDIADGQLSLQAMSLVYTTLITLVPLLAISFSVLKGFGVHNQIEPFLLNLLDPLGPEKSAEIASRVIEFVDNIQVGVLGALGLGLLIYAVIALMQKIENAFNYIWRVGQDRTLAQRFSDYLSVLLMGPLLIFISAGISTTVRHHDYFQILQSTGYLGPLFDIGSFFVPWVVMAIGFTFVYIYMPNMKVRLGAAFIGALVAALLWKSMGYAFSSVIAGSANYVAIYAAFATLIVLMIWLYLSWLVVLIGANVSFYVQFPRYIRVSRGPLVLSAQTKIVLGLGILELVAKAHYHGDLPWTLDRLSKILNVPILAVQNVYALLEQGGILTLSQTDGASIYPACPLDTTPLENAVRVLEEGGQEGWTGRGGIVGSDLVRKLTHDIRSARQETLTHRSIYESLVKPDQF